MSANQNFNNSTDVGAQSNPFWTFSLELYSHKPVASACIAMQDRHGLDVNIILFCCWLARRNVTLGPQQIRRLILKVRDIRKKIETLRELRRSDHSRHYGLKEKVLALELDHERIEQDILFQATPLDKEVQNPASGDTGFANAAASIANYFSLMAINPGARDIGDVRLILLTAFSKRGTLDTVAKFSNNHGRWRELWTV